MAARTPDPMQAEFGEAEAVKEPRGFQAERETDLGDGEHVFNNRVQIALLAHDAGEA